LFALLIAAAVVDAAIAFYLLLIGPIIVTGWNNTQFDPITAVIVYGGVLLLIAGPVAAFFIRRQKPTLALACAWLPAVIAVIGFVIAIAAEI
jgi:hypothetical protein